MTSPAIRPATLEDAAAIADLSNQLGYPTATAQAIARMRTLLEADDHAVLVASLPDGTVAGWIHVFLAHRVESATFAELGGLVVAAKHRRQGLGRALVAAAVSWTAAQGVAKLRVRTRRERTEAHAFYQGLGFTLNKKQDIFDKSLELPG